MKNYLISGGAGFLGSNLVKRLLTNEDNKITVIDNLQTGNKKNLEIFFENPNFKFIEHDIIEPIILDEHFDYIINLACPASPSKYYKDPVKTLETCSIGTKNMLELALKNKARFFHTSTSEIYGDPKEHPQKETYFGNVESYCKRSCYDEGKRYAEALIYAYRHEKGVNTGFIRIFNTYGPMMDPDDGRVVTNFIKQALIGTNITIEGDGNHTRSFCYVDDQIEGMMRMIHSDEEGPINIGNPKEFTINQLADLVIKMTDSKSKKIHIKEALSDPKLRKPDIRLAKNKLNWEPTTKIEEGLQKTINWLQSASS